MHPATTFLIVALIAAPALAGDDEAVRLDARAFEALTKDRTAHFSSEGQYYGSEAYFEGRASAWRDTEGDCRDGIWWAREQYICFRYETVSCWEIFREADGSHYAVSDDGFRVDFMRFDRGALNCSVPLV